MSKSRTSSINGHGSDLDKECIEEIKLTLKQLKVGLGRSASENLSFKIEEKLLEKHNRSKSIKDDKIRQQKSLAQKNCAFKPKISENSRKIIEPKRKKDMQKMIEKYNERDQKVEAVIRPRDAIPPPEYSSIKPLFNSRNEAKKLDEKPDKGHLKSGIIEKTDFFARKKSEGIKKAILEKEDLLLKECTFKPDLSKTLQRKASYEALTEVCLTEEKGKFDESLRLPAPNPKTNRKKESQSLNRKIYDKISPDDQVYGFKEGINLGKMLEKSKPMLKYKVSNSPYT